MTKNIILIGFMGSGKSTIGRQLAKELNMIFLDMDETIQQNLNMTIQEIFKQKGESFFRAEELLLSRKSSSLTNMVIATGGGIVLQQKAMKSLSTNGIIIYLECDFETIIQRIKTESSRPLFTPNDLLNFRKIFSSRISLYEENTHHMINVEGKSIESICSEVVQIIKKNS